MNNLIKTDKEYQQWLIELKQRIRQSQIKAALRVNTELLELYWILFVNNPFPIGVIALLNN